MGLVGASVTPIVVQQGGTDWWAIVLSGVVGSVVGVAGALGIAYWLWRKQRKDDRALAACQMKAARQLSDAQQRAASDLAKQQREAEVRLAERQRQLSNAQALLELLDDMNNQWTVALLAPVNEKAALFKAALSKRAVAVKLAMAVSPAVYEALREANDIAPPKDPLAALTKYMEDQHDGIANATLILIALLMPELPNKAGASP